MRGETHLPWMFLGRKVRPFAFAVTIATATMCWLMVTSTSSLQSFDHPGVHVGYFAILTVFSLIWGWWRKDDCWAMWGLLLSAGVWTGVSILLVADGPRSWPQVILAFAWAIGSGGAYLAESINERRGPSRV